LRKVRRKEIGLFTGILMAYINNTKTLEKIKQKFEEKYWGVGPPFAIRHTPGIHLPYTPDVSQVSIRGIPYPPPLPPHMAKILTN
jgi:hypothetical protein